MVNKIILLDPSIRKYLKKYGINKYIQFRNKKIKKSKICNYGMCLIFRCLFIIKNLFNNKYSDYELM